MADSTFADPDVTTFARLDGLGLRVVGQFLEPDRAVLECRGVDADARWPRCRRWAGARTLITGAAAGGGGAVRGPPRCAGWRTTRGGGARRSCWSRSAGTAAT